MKSKINWGIIGLGKIANKFASDLLLSKKANLYAVASRDFEKAKFFGKKYSSVKYFGSCEELAKDPEIDIVYIATPHVFHFENTMLCLNNNKAVLCEKPLGMDSAEVKAMLEKAKSKKLFLMEGIWTRFIPATVKLIELLKEGEIGDVLFVKADFGFKPKYNPESRIFNKKLGGGSLLDIGIYPIYFSLIALGLPSDIKAMARITPTGVDGFCAMLFNYENEAKAILESTIEANTPTETYIYGTKCMLKLHSRFHYSEKVSLFQNGELKQEFNLKYTGNGYFHEIEEVNNCLLNNELESEKLPLNLSLNLISIIDKVKHEIGLTYKNKAQLK